MDKINKKTSKKIKLSRKSKSVVNKNKLIKDKSVKQNVNVNVSKI